MNIENQIKEIWQPILEVGGNYEISNLGQVRNSKTLNLIQHNIRHTGYHYVTIGSRVNNTRQCMSVHRLVAKYFCIGYNVDLVVNHIDGNKSNNIASNLEWVTQSENIRHAYKLGLISSPPTRPKKKVLCVTTGTTYESVRDASRQTGISQGNISQACNGHRSHAGGFKWIFTECYN